MHGPPGHPVMAALDADKDGSLSAEEIAAASDALKTLDKNDDGKLSEDELRPPRGPRGQAQGRRGGPDGFGPPPGPPGEFGPPPGGPQDGPGRGQARRRGSREDRFADGPPGRGPRDFGPGPPPGEPGPRVLPPGAREMLELSEEQNAKIDAIEADVRTKIEELLSAEQLDQLNEMFAHGPPPPGDFGGPGGPPRGGDRFEGPDGPRGPGGRPPRRPEGD